MILRTATAVYPSPIGSIEITADDSGVRALSFVDAEERAPSTPVLEMAVAQLREYFEPGPDGPRTAFTVPLAMRGTAFQLAVWGALIEIPFGETRTYGDTARRIGRPRAVRAVGGANHRNPVPIFVPCHRVIGADGSLTGYGGGLWRKEWLLQHEKD